MEGILKFSPVYTLFERHSGRLRILESNEITHDSYLLFPCEKATIVPELASSCRRAAAIVNSGTRRSSVAARSKLASFSRSSLSSPEVVKLDHFCASLYHSTISSLIIPTIHFSFGKGCYVI